MQLPAPLPPRDLAATRGMLVDVDASLQHVSELTTAGAAVAPVVDRLRHTHDQLVSVRPALEQAQLSAWLLGELDRVRMGADQLASALQELVTRDGMERFDPDFAADDAQWDSNFADWREIVQRAIGVLDARTA